MTTSMYQRPCALVSHALKSTVEDQVPVPKELYLLKLTSNSNSVIPYPIGICLVVA